jgi:hypothetical protein
MHERMFKHALDVLFTVGKNKAHWRERQLLDFLASRMLTKAGDKDA